MSRNHGSYNAATASTQKRQTATAGDLALDGLAWTYNQIGSDKSTLTTYNALHMGRRTQHDRSPRCSPDPTSNRQHRVCAVGPSW